MANATHAAFRGRAAHSLTDAMAHEPRRFVGDRQHPVHLMRRNALLARVHQMKGQNPLMKRNMRTLHDGADRNCEVLTASVALKQTRTVAFAIKALNGFLVRIAAMRADRAFRPAQALHVGAGGILVMENLVGELHGLSPMWPMYASGLAMSSI